MATEPEEEEEVKAGDMPEMLTGDSLETPAASSRDAALSRLAGVHCEGRQRTDRFGFFIPNDYAGPSASSPPLGSVGSDSTGAGGSPTVSRPHEGPPPSSTIHLHHTPSSTPLTEKALKAHRKKLLLENNRLKKWQRMVENWETFRAKNPKTVKSRCRKGIPDAMRGVAWPLLTGARRRRMLNKGLYATLLRRPVAAKDEVIEIIERDIHRTFPLHAMFSEAGGIGQTCLFRVLRAYAQYDKRVGYCQGMGFITAMFLSYMPEEDAFFMLLSVMNFPPHSLTGLFSPGLPRILVLEHQLEGLIKSRLPKLAAHFDRWNVAPSMYSAQWFLTIFTYNFPFGVVVRIWDAFLSEGWKVIFRIAYAVLKVSEAELLTKSFEGIMMYFRHLPAMLEVDSLMDAAFSLSLSQRELDDLEAAYHAKPEPDRS